MSAKSPIVLLTLMLCGCPCDGPSPPGWCPAPDPCDPLQACLDAAPDPCTAYIDCTLSSQQVGTECHPTCGDGDCQDVCEPYDCVATHQCMWECADLCDTTCLLGCWNTSPDCLGTACISEVGCDPDACP